MGCVLRNARVDFSIKYTLDEKTKDIIIDDIVKSLIYEDDDTEEWRVHEIDAKHVIKYSYLPTIKKNASIVCLNYVKMVKIMVFILKLHFLQF